MKKKMIWLSAAFLILLMTGSVNASYIGTVDENKDKTNNVSDYLIEQGYTLGETGLEGLTKIDAPGTGSGGFTITNNGTSGTWSAPAGVDFITVKGGTQYAVYEVGGLTSGVWTTEMLLNNGGNVPDLSHISFWKSPGYTPPGGGGGSSAVPEPTTMALLFGGLGILGYNKFRNRFARKKD